MSEDFTLKEMVKEVRHDLKQTLQALERHSTMLTNIEKQAEKTNGRVTRLEESHVALENQQTMTTTKVGIIATGVSSAVTALISIFISQTFK